MGYTDCKRISAVPGLKAAWAGQNGGEDYEYCIIEEINEGVFKDTSKRWILKREGTNKDNYVYVPIEEPKEIAKVRNFGIG